MHTSDDVNRPAPGVLAWARDQRTTLFRLHDELGFDDWDTDDLAATWNAAAELARDLAVLVRDLAVELGERVHADGGEATYAHIGPVHTVRRSNVKWDGAQVLAALTVDVIDTGTGEKVRAVPLDVLRDVLPAVGEGQTSSKWKATGIGEHLGDADRYRETSYNHPLPILGEKP